MMTSRATPGRRSRRSGTADCRAFTLIELIVAITVISIMASLIVPRIIQYVEATKKNVLLYNMTSIRRQLANYAKDHDGCYPRCLRELVDKQYLPSIPVDPYTDRPYWEIAIWNQDANRYEWVKVGADYMTTEAVVSLKMYTQNQVVNALAKSVTDYKWDKYGICNIRVGDPLNPYFTRKEFIDPLSTDEAGILFTVETKIDYYPNYGQALN